MFALKIDHAPDDEISIETRRASDVIDAPRVAFYNPDTLQFREMMLPVVPGGPVSCGLGQVVYNHQPKWDRGDVSLAGPVRSFFRNMMNNNRTRRL